MNLWLAAAAALLVAVIPCVLVAARGDVVDALVGLETATTVVTLVLLLLSVGFDRPPYADVALVTVGLAFAGGMVFVRYLERWR